MARTSSSRRPARASRAVALLASVGLLAACTGNTEDEVGGGDDDEAATGDAVGDFGEGRDRTLIGGTDRFQRERAVARIENGKGAESLRAFTK